jgi:hypothetical protein
MRNLKAEFLDELEKSIERRQRLELAFKALHLGLGVVIAGCGFLTAAASQAELKTTWVSSPTSLLVFGLLSAICAIINQILTPTEKVTYHRNTKKALEYIRGDVKFRNMPIKNAQTLRTLALTNPELILGRLSNQINDEKEAK